MRKSAFIVACLIGIFLAIREKQNPPPPAPEGPRQKPKTYRPVKNECQWLFARDAKARGQLEIGNGNDHAVLVKLISQFVNRKACSCVILPKSSLMIEHVPDGHYQLQFEMGDEIITGTEKFWQPIAQRRMSKTLDFMTTREVSGGNIITKTPVLRLTVHAVEGGNAEFVSIPPADFDRY